MKTMGIKKSHLLRGPVYVLVALAMATMPTIVFAQDSGAGSNTGLAPSAISNQPYILSSGDELSVSVLGHDDMARSVTILPDGTFDYPTAGRVHAAGLTVDELESLLATGLSQICNQPEVTISVTQSRPISVSVLGAVRNPGLYTYKPGFRLIDLLAACGGPDQAPELTQASLYTDGGKSFIPIDLVKLMAGDSSQNLPLSPGDVVMMSPRDPSTALIQVAGEVAKPGQYPVPAGGVPILPLLIEAGGANPDAALTRVQILHAGQVTTVNIRPMMSNLSDSAEGDVLVAGDILLVPKNEAQILALGNVRSPGLYTMPDGRDLHLTEAIAMFGGVDPNGDKKNVDIVRRAADGGKPTMIAVNTEDLLKGSPDATDVVLQPGDIIYVQQRHQVKSVGDILNSISPLALLGSIAGY